MTARKTHTARPVGQMDAPVSRHRPPAVKAGFLLAPGGAADDWRERAACRWDRLKARGIPAGIFFPFSFTAPEGVREAERAKAICRDECPVRAQCLRFAVDSGSADGVFGGLDPDERRAAKRRATRKAASE